MTENRALGPNLQKMIWRSRGVRENQPQSPARGNEASAIESHKVAVINFGRPTTENLSMVLIKFLQLKNINTLPILEILIY